MNVCVGGSKQWAHEAQGRCETIKTLWGGALNNSKGVWPISLA